MVAISAVSYLRLSEPSPVGDVIGGIHSQGRLTTGTTLAKTQLAQNVIKALVLKV